MQQVVEEALERLLGRPVRVVGASRTDAGVHARGQAAHLELRIRSRSAGSSTAPTTTCPRTCGCSPPPPMPPGFHARKHAAGKEYLYRLSRAAVLSPLDAPFVAPAPAGIDPARMARAAELLPGRHDFSAFALAGGSHGQPFRRIFSAALGRERGRSWPSAIVGEGFLRGMVRALVGTLIEVGAGRRTVESFAALLAGQPRVGGGPDGSRPRPRAATRLLSAGVAARKGSRDPRSCDGKPPVIF